LEPWEMEFWKDSRARVLEGEPLSRHTSFRIGGPATLVVPDSAEELSEILDGMRRAGGGGGFRLLGKGTNLLVSEKGLAEPVVKLSEKGFGGVRAEGTRIVAGAAAPLAKLLWAAAEEGLSGLEALAGIPGSVGGAVRMNAGGKELQIGRRVVEVEAVDPGGGSKRIGGRELSFGYRASSLSGSIVTEVRLELERSSSPDVRGRMREYLEAKRRSQPLGEPSAGCVFKNPAEIPAGRLIDELGMKGIRVGGARVSEKHANYIVSDGTASFADVVELIGTIRDRASVERGIRLELEIEIWE